VLHIPVRLITSSGGPWSGAAHDHCCQLVVRGRLESARSCHSKGVDFDPLLPHVFVLPLAVLQATVILVSCTIRR
jgi:hypothetical protein